MTDPPATLDNVEVKDMGLTSLLKSLIEVPLGTGGTSACFQIRGTLDSRNDGFKTSVIAGTRISENSFNTRFGRPSGPPALDALILLSVKNIRQN